MENDTIYFNIELACFLNFLKLQCDTLTDIMVTTCEKDSDHKANLFNINNAFKRSISRMNDFMDEWASSLRSDEPTKKMLVTFKKYIYYYEEAISDSMSFTNYISDVKYVANSVSTMSLSLDCRLKEIYKKMLKDAF